MNTTRQACGLNFKKGTARAATMILTLILFVALIVSALPASAAGGHAHGGVHGHAALPAFFDFLVGLGVYYFNFGLYLVLMYLILKKPLQRAFADRRSSVEEKVLAGERALAAAALELKEAQGRMSTIAAEVERIKKEISVETASEIQAIKHEATTKASRIAQIAQEAAEAEVRTIEAIVREELIESALLIARERIGRENSPEEDRRFRDSAIHKVGSLVTEHPSQGSMH